VSGKQNHERTTGNVSSQASFSSEGAGDSALRYGELLVAARN
jgi:hypothetical protein